MTKDNHPGSRSQCISIDPDEISRALSTILLPGQVTEVRALEVSNSSYRRPHVESGYFDNLAKLVSEVQQIRDAKGVYYTVNPVNPALLARSANRIRIVGKDPLTSDSDIVLRRWLPIDVDPVRPSGISSTNLEHEAALLRAREIRDFLKQEGWPNPFFADSGNGGHLLYRVDLPVNDDGIIQHALEALAFQFNDQVVTIDQGVFNPARILKLPGTMARKGDNTPDRPHRMARRLETSERLIPVPDGLLAKLAASRPVAEKLQDQVATRNGKVFNVQHWIEDHNLEVSGPSDWKGGQKWVFPKCPWNEAHTNASAYIVQFGNGAIAAGCHHNGCTGKRWYDLRDLVEPGWREKQETEETEKEEVRRLSVADRLCGYVLQKDSLLFLDQFGQPHVLVDDQSLPLTSRCYGWLRHLMWEHEKKSVSGESLSQAAGTLAAMAENGNEVRELALRSAWHENALYVALAPKRVICIDAHGWRLIDNPPVLFRHFSNSKPLPAPESGGNTESLMELLRLRSERHVRLLTTYIALGLHPDISRPILLATGPQGAAKSTRERTIKRLLDPSTPESIRVDPRDALQKASHAAVVFIDNATSFPDWAIDMICRLVTGEGDSKRKLYTDDDDIIYELRRLILINGINPPSNRPDLLDRCLCIEFERILDAERVPEKKYWESFERERPKWLGAIFDLLTAAMQCHPNVNLHSLPRLADWGEWGAAIYEAKGWGMSQFLEDWTGNVKEQHKNVIDASTLIQVLSEFMKDYEIWEGLPTELLHALTVKAEQLNIRTDHDKLFPKNADWLWRRIREYIPVLEMLGLKPDRDGRKIIVRKVSRDI